MATVSVKDISGGWLFWFATMGEARAYAKEMRHRGYATRIRKA